MLILLAAACSPTVVAQTEECHDGPNRVAEPSAARFAGDCAKQGGSDCVAERFVSKVLAECEARKAGLAPGITSVESYLVYNHRLKTVIWVVSNTLATEGKGSERGEYLAVHATNGKVLERGGWGSAMAQVQSGKADR